MCSLEDFEKKLNEVRSLNKGSYSNRCVAKYEFRFAFSTSLSHAVFRPIINF